MLRPLPFLLPSYILETNPLNVTFYSFINPGGYVEFTDFDLEVQSPDGTFKHESALALQNREMMKSARSAGTEPNPGRYLEGWIKDAGFEDVTVMKMPLPIGTWAKDTHLVRITQICQLSRERKHWERIELIERVENSRRMELYPDNRRHRRILHLPLSAPPWMEEGRGVCPIIENSRRVEGPENSCIDYAL